jgi:metal-responsive CopG/Arc/MetJ family transcriptional regulator
MSEQDELIEFNEERIRLTVGFKQSTLDKIDRLRDEWGMKSRGAIVERLLDELFSDHIVDESAEK